MTQRGGFQEILWPSDPINADLPVEWAKGAACQILGWVWSGYDILVSKHLADIDLNLGKTKPVQLERKLTQSHFLGIQQVWAQETKGFSSIQPCHESQDFRNIEEPRAKPAANDIGFFHIEHPSWLWPIEAKVLPTSNTLADYWIDIEKFERGTAAALVSEGGIIGYLLSGMEIDFLMNVSTKLGQTLQIVPEFEHRNHQSSHHLRPPHPELRLHHMIMKTSNLNISKQNKK